MTGVDAADDSHVALFSHQRAIRHGAGSPDPDS